jgi:5-methylcytosine-specific restriction endonuclease McrA
MAKPLFYREDGAHWCNRRMRWILPKAHNPGWKPGNDLTRKIKIALCEAQNWRCCHCGCILSLNPNHPHKTFATFEHVVPRSEGGSDLRENLVIACWLCNNERGAKLIEGFPSVIHVP